MMLLMAPLGSVLDGDDNLLAFIVNMYNTRKI